MREPMIAPFTGASSIPASAPRPAGPRRLVWKVVGGVVLLAPVIFPGLCRSRESANRVKCASNLRQIGIALQVYAGDHQGQLPASLQELLSSEDLTAEVFICPSSADKRAEGPTTQATIAMTAQPGHCSYVFLGKDLRWTNDAKAVLAYEPLANHERKEPGMNVLFGDGHVEFLNASQVPPSLQRDAR